MSEAQCLHDPQTRWLRTLALGALGVLLSACGGGAGGGGNDGTFVSRQGIVVTGVADDGTATSPLAGGTCRVVDDSGTIVDTATVAADGSYLLLVSPGLQVFIVCTDVGQSRLAIRTLVSTVGIAAGGEIGGQDVLPATTVLARMVAQELADDPTLDAGARIAALRGQLVALDATTAPINVDLQLLADAATLTYDAFRDAGIEADLDAVLADLFDDGVLDFFGGADLAGTVEAAVAQRVAAAGRSLADAVLATHPAFDFTVLNVGGARSRLQDVARFATVVAAARTAAGDRSVLALSGGNTLSANLELAAGLETQDPFFDSLATDLLGVDAFAIGVDDLELGPPVYGIFLDRLAGAGIAVLTDIDSSLEPNAFIPDASASTATVLTLERSARRIGLVSATPENLPALTSTRSLRTFTGDTRIARLQSGIDGALASGARLIVMLSSLRSPEAVSALLAQLRGVDLVVTLPGVPAVSSAFTGEGPVPLALTAVIDADGGSVPVIPAVGDYAGLVAADLRADPLGRLDGASTSAAVRRVAGAGEALPTDENADVREQVLVPLQAAIDDLNNTTGSQTQVTLDPVAERMFVGETNWGNLVADSVLFSARSQANSFGSLAANAGLVDAGSIDSDAEITAGALSRARLLQLVDDGQVVAVLQQVTPTDLKRLLEFSFANQGGDLFAQISSLRIEFDPDGTAQVLDEDGSVLVAGTRVVRVVLGNNTNLVLDGAPVDGAPALALAISERIRDTYPLASLNLINVGTSVSQALEAFVRVTLGGTIRSDDFPVTNTGRIAVVAAP